MPKNAARNTQFISYATPNLQARQFIDKETLENPLIFPSSKTLEKCEHQVFPKPQIQRRFNMIYHQITR